MLDHQISCVFLQDTTRRAYLSTVNFPSEKGGMGKDIGFSHEILAATSCISWLLVYSSALNVCSSVVLVGARVYRQQKIFQKGTNPSM